MEDPWVAVVVRVPDEYFSDNDDICFEAGRFVCSRLESHLIEDGHNIPDWIRGGCEEDWGIYFESQRDAQIFDYSICFFPVTTGEKQCYMVVQYQVKVPWLKRLFNRPRAIGTGHPLHKTMEEFGRTFASSRMLTKSQCNSEY